MSEYSVTQVDSVYRCGASCRETVRAVQDADFQAFCVQLKRFIQALADEASSDYWAPFVRGLRRYRFLGAAMPVAFSSPDLGGPELAATLREHVQRVELVYPNYAQQACDLLDSLEAVSRRDDAPLWEACRSIASEPGKHALLLLRPPRNADLGELIDRLFPDGALQWITAPALRGLRCYDRIITVGPLAWFPPYVIDAPRAREVHVVRYGWISDPARDASTFIATLKGVPPPGSDRRPLPPPNMETELDAAEVVPPIEWAQLGHSAGAVPVDDDDIVKARLFLLEGGDAVFLEDDEDSETTVIDLDQDAALSVRRLAIHEIERGMFVLLRTEGGGDYIPELADRLLGAKSQEIRDVQRMWKRQLRIAVKENGPEAVCFELRANGSIRANETNLRTWMSNRSLRTQHYEDFLAMMRLLNLSQRAQEIWDKMGVLRIAHQTAGQRVRKLLIARVQEAAAEELQRRGRVDFELPGEDGGTLTAFRVVDIAPEATLVSSFRISHPFELEGTSWQG